MGSTQWKWCGCKGTERIEVTTFGYQKIRLMCQDCGGKIGETEGELKLAYCLRCGSNMPEESDVTGEGPVYWKVTGGPFCSMECVVGTHREWLEREKTEMLNRWFLGKSKADN